MFESGSEKEQRELYLTEKIKNFAYNIKYKTLSYFQEYDKLSILRPNDEIFILGIKYVAHQENVKQVNEEIYNIFTQTPWLTYRSGFPQLKNQLTGSFVSDTGWGCMVRVGQMLFAQVIKHHQKITEEKEMLKVLELFNDFDKKQPFSIQNIAKIARIEYGLKPGEWYNPSQISFILNTLHEKEIANEIKLKFCLFNSGNLFFDILVKAMINGPKRCSCLSPLKQQFACTQCNKAKNSVSAIILTRLGLNKPEAKYLSILDKFVEFPQFQGILGGKPEKALYFVGKQNNHYIYLDPHYVQTADKDIKQNRESYFCGSFRKCHKSAIDSSMGICFYLRDMESLNNFHRRINKLKDQNKEDFFIFVSDETPSYMREPTKKSVETWKDDEAFQTL